MYRATEDGQIIGKRGKPLALFAKGNGYLTFSQSNGYGNPNQTLVHRFVWEQFNGPIPEDKNIDHINGDKHDNRLCNLQLLTPQENAQKASTNKLDELLVRFIKSRLGKQTQRSIASLVGVSEQTICDIKNGRAWVNIGETH